jgi:hypothetical protein
MFALFTTIFIYLHAALCICARQRELSAGSIFAALHDKFAALSHYCALPACVSYLGKMFSS